MPTVRTARSWPENAVPTAEQFAAWLLACTDTERVEVCERLLAANAVAVACFEQDHDGYPEQVAALQKQARDAYANGWQDAIAAVSQRLDAHV